MSAAGRAAEGSAQGPAQGPARRVPTVDARYDAGIVTGIAAESRVVVRSLPSIDPAMPIHDLEGRLACAGADSERARACATRLLREGADALVSFGIAGGLDPALKPGDLLLPAAVREPDGRETAMDGVWRSRVEQLLAAAGQAPRAGLHLGSAEVIAGAGDKGERFRDSGASAVDMESHAVAAVARQAQVPMLVLRAVADPAERCLPRLVMGAIGPDGEPRNGLIAARLCLQPWRLPDLLRLRDDTRQALRVLARAVQAVGPALFGRL